MADKAKALPALVALAVAAAAVAGAVPALLAQRIPASVALAASSRTNQAGPITEPQYAQLRIASPTR